MADYPTDDAADPLQPDAGGKHCPGDLTAIIEAESTDELGRLSTAMAAMNQKLRDLISQIKESVVSVASASSQIAAGNTDLASRTEEQSAVVETAASMEELTSTVKRNADNAREASNLRPDGGENAQSGGKLCRTWCTRWITSPKAPIKLKTSSP
ncbi:hypothetical protein CWS02_19020 [Enterobacter sp. EA-1]|nr:hypothetical protein CWS02_19020 [Enterobacter sp. EA-1]